MRQKWSRGQVEGRLANLPPCLIGMEACVGDRATPIKTHNVKRVLADIDTDDGDSRIELG
jgi:hypothetical protein